MLGLLRFVVICHCSALQNFLVEVSNGKFLAELPNNSGVDYQEGTKTDVRSAVCRFTGAGSGGVVGVVRISQLTGEVPAVFKLNITGLTPGKHGFHVHANGDLGSDCKDAGGHYNPYNKTHGSPTTERHVGDLGNVLADSTGAVVSDIEDSMATLIGDIDITGKAIVIHEGEDDLGQGGDSGSLATGNAGGRAGCCIIERN